MNIFTSRYAQVSLALIIAVLAIVALGTSASAEGINTNDSSLVQVDAPPQCCDNPPPCCPKPPQCCNGIEVNQVVVINQQWEGCCDKEHDKWKPEEPKKDHKCCEKPWYPDPKKHDKCCDKWDGKGGHDGYGEGGYGEDGYDQGGYGGDEGWGKEADYGHGKKHFDCEYKVQRGDHLFRIALRYNLPWPVLAYANGLTNGNYIYAGQILSVPCKW
jgi:hypothetical protein